MFIKKPLRDFLIKWMVYQKASLLNVLLPTFDIHLNVKIKHPNTFAETIEKACLIEKGNQIQREMTLSFHNLPTHSKVVANLTIKVLRPSPSY